MLNKKKHQFRIWSKSTQLDLFHSLTSYTWMYFWTVWHEQDRWCIHVFVHSTCASSDATDWDWSPMHATRQDSSQLAQNGRPCSVQRVAGKKVKKPNTPWSVVVKQKTSLAKRKHWGNCLANGNTLWVSHFLLLIMQFVPLCGVCPKGVKLTFCCWTSHQNQVQKCNWRSGFTCRVASNSCSFEGHSHDKYFCRS